jgi:hypothetical protein
MDAMDAMDTAQARSSSSGVGEIKTSSNESLLNRSQRKSDQVVTRSRKRDQAACGLRNILGNILENIIPGPRRQHSPNKEQDDTPRTGVEAETPSKSRFSPLSSPSPCQSRATRDLQRTPPPGAIAFEIGEEASFDGFQQHQQQLPVTAFGVAMCRSPVDSSNHEEQRTSTPRRLQFGAAKYAKLPPDSYVEDIESVHRRAIDNARAIDRMLLLGRNNGALALGRSPICTMLLIRVFYGSHRMPNV